MANRNAIGKVVIIFLAGGAVGALSGLLFAPRSGAETRQKIKKTSSDAGNKVKEKLGEAKSGVVHLFSRGKEKVKDIKTEIQDTVEVGKEVYNKKKKDLASET